MEIYFLEKCKSWFFLFFSVHLPQLGGSIFELKLMKDWSSEFDGETGDMSFS